MKQLIFSIILTVLASCLASDKVLLIVDSFDDIGKHSMFLNSLISQGFELDTKHYSDPKLQLREWDQWIYKHVIYFAPDVEVLGGPLDVASLVEFIDGGGNMILCTSPNSSSLTRELVRECGVDSVDNEQRVWDYVAGLPPSAGAPDVLKVTDVASISAIVGSESYKTPVLYRGTAVTIPPSSKQVTPILTAPKSAYVGGPQGDIPKTGHVIAGNMAVLVAGVQARNNARIVVVGGKDIFSNELAMLQYSDSIEQESVQHSSNQQLVQNIAAWAFGKSGVLSSSELRHWTIKGDGTAVSQERYQVGDKVNIELDLYEVQGDSRVPHKSEDVQFELVMLDPYVRSKLEHLNNGTYRTEITTPHVPGVFKFRVEYGPHGYTYINKQVVLPVTPVHSSMYERFIPAAFPYYTSSLVVMAGFSTLLVALLYHKE